MIDDEIRYFSDKMEKYENLKFENFSVRYRNPIDSATTATSQDKILVKNSQRSNYREKVTSIKNSKPNNKPQINIFEKVKSRYSKATKRISLKFPQLNKRGNFTNLNKPIAIKSHT